MMGKRYYCDYCDRSFADGAENRKKHLASVHHQKLRKAHYDSFKDASTTLQDEMQKKPCRKFQQNGHCEYGPSCKYSHLTPLDIQKLEEQAKQEKEGIRNWLRNTDASEPDIKGLLEKVMKRKENLSRNTSNNVCNPILPKVLKSIPNIPPSLIPSKATEFLKQETADWER